MNYNTLAREAHENAVAHGWWDEDRPFAEIIGLIHFELSKALEEYRDGRELNEIYYPTKSMLLPSQTPKPEGIPIELADAMIRVLDFLEHEKVDIDGWIKESHAREAWIPDHITAEMDNPPGLIAAVHWMASASYALSRSIYRVTSNYWLMLILMLVKIQEFCDNNEIDIKRALEIKMDYNKTRPHKHGKKI